MTQILELSDKKFKITMTNTLRVLMRKLDNMQEELGNVNRKMETLRKNQKEIPGIKNSVTGTKNGWAHNRRNETEERVRG